MSTMDELSRLFDEARAVRPPDGAANAGLQRLLNGLASQGAPLPVAAAGSLQLGRAMVVKWIGAGFVVGLASSGTAAYVSRSSAPAAVVASAAVSNQIPSPKTVANPVAELPAAQPVPSGAEAMPPKGASKRGSAPQPSSLASERSTLDEELRLITAAKRELDGGRPHLAQVWLDEHRQRFPSGVFGLERDALIIHLSCSRSKQPALARAFALQHPGAPMLAQLQRSCGVESAPTNELPHAHEDFSAPTNVPSVAGEPISK